jgi:imidazolonepropionase-like amidohydrolase
VKSKGSPSDEVFPDDIELEAVVDVLRGKVKVNTHCYTTIDLEAYVRHTNEFKFPLAAFHHAHEAYLVPDLLKRTYGGTPAVALFSLNGNYKVEAIAGSPFAPAILASHNITVHLKSDHPVTDSRRVLNQAAQAAHYGEASRHAQLCIADEPTRLPQCTHIDDQRRGAHARPGPPPWLRAA